LPSDGSRCQQRVDNAVGRQRIRSVAGDLQPAPSSFVRVEASGHSDAVLLARIDAGDDAALAAVYDQHASMVYGLARRVTGDEHVAYDVSQDVFTYLWEQPGRVDLSRGSLRTYLAVVAHRRAVDQVRHSTRRVRIEAAVEPSKAPDGPEAVVVAAAAHAWRRKRLAEMMGRLPPEQRAAVTLAYYEGLTHREVARAQGVPVGTAKSRLWAALARLRTMLDDELRTAT
jgi:RNA polymerase sigma factor (sigma-70 family)